MEDKKGFTLVELLAVIVVIGILALVVVPSVTGYVTNTRTETYKAHEKAMMEAAKSYTVECIQNGIYCGIPKSGDQTEVYLKDLIAGEYITKLQDPSNKSKECDPNRSYVIISNTGGKTGDSYKYESCLYCTTYSTNNPNCDLRTSQGSQDKTDPVCGAIENASTTWTQGTRTVTVGCSDPESECTRDKFSTTFKQTTKVGYVTIRNKAKRTTDCPVNVYVDNTPPTCELKIVGGVEEESTGWLSGDVSVEIVPGSIKDGTNESGVQTYGIGTSYKNPSYNKETSFSLDKIIGTTTVFGYVKDNVGNEGTCSVTVKTGIAKPKMNIYYGYQLMPLKERYTTSGLTINHESGAATTTSSSPSISFTGMSKYQAVVRAVVELNNTTLQNGSAYSLTYDGNTVHGLTEEGSRIIFEMTPGTYSNYTFSLGTESGKSMTIKRIELQVPKSVYTTSKPISVTLIEHPDEIIATDQYSFDNGAHYSGINHKEFSPTTEDYVAYARTKNDIGMPSDPAKYTVKKLDKTGPQITLTPNTTNPTNQDVTLTAQTSDAESGVVEYMFAERSTMTYYASEYTAITLNKNLVTKQTTTPVNKTLFFYAKDEAGNVSQKSYKISVIDKIAPVCEAISGHADIKCTDTGDNNYSASGINAWYYGTTNTTTGTYTSVDYNVVLNTSGKDKVNSDGTYYLYVKDRAGNISEVKSDIYYKVTYRGNTGSTPSPEVEYVRKGQTPTYASTSSKTGYTLIGYNTDSTATSPLGEYPINGATTMYAVWKKNTYYIKFDGGEKSQGSMSNVTCTYDENCTLTENTLTRKGYTFSGWEFNGKSYDDKATVKNLTAEPNGTVTLHAKWTPNKFTITFHGNSNNSGSMSPITCTYDQDCILPTSTYGKTGYVFYAWALTSDGADKYQANQNIKNESEGEPIDLYVKWGKIKYTIEFLGNGESSGTTDSVLCEYDTDCKLTKNGFYKRGYTFSQWSDSMNTYANEAVVRNLTTVHNSVVQLSATWKVNNYKVSFDGNGATSGGNLPQIECTYDQTCTAPANNFARTGYIYQGWGTTQQATRIYGSDITNVFASGNNNVMYAQWKPISYKVIYVGGTGTSGSTSQTTCYYDTPCTLAANGFSKPGYSFSKWTNGSNEYPSQGQVTNLSTTDNGTVTLTAQWEPNKYTINFGKNGGDGTTSNVECTYDSDCVLTTNGYSKEGYTFNGWSYGGNTYGDGATVRNLAQSGSITLNASWKANNYTIQFDGNGANGGSTANMSCTYGVEYPLRTNGFTKTGYHFTGWTYDNNDYSNGQKVKNLTATNNGTVTFKAKWEANTYTIKFAGNNNTSGSTADKTCTYGVDCKLTKNGFVRIGYNFSGWTYNNNSYSDEQTISNLTDDNGATITFTAKWEGKSYKVNYNGNGNTGGSMNQKTCTVGQDCVLDNIGFTKSGYHFFGWATSASGDVIYSNKQNIKDYAGSGNDFNLYAKWESDN